MTTHINRACYRPNLRQLASTRISWLVDYALGPCPISRYLLFGCLVGHCWEPARQASWWCLSRWRDGWMPEEDKRSTRGQRSGNVTSIIALNIRHVAALEIPKFRRWVMGSYIGGPGSIYSGILFYGIHSADVVGWFSEAFVHNLALCTRIAKLRRGKWTWRGVPQLLLTWITTSSLFNPISVPTVGWFVPAHLEDKVRRV